MAAMVLIGVVIVEFGIERRRPAPPHVLLIVLDTVRADRVSIGGASERDTTPFLASLARKGTVFSRARSAANWTLPAHASLFTGLAPSEHGCHFEHRWLADQAQTLAEVLRAGTVGYRTAGFSSNVNVSGTFNLDQGFDHWFESWTDAGVRSGARTATDAVCQEALGWIAANPGGPSFVFVNVMDAHLPYRAAPGFESHFGAPDVRVDALVRSPDLLDRVLAGDVAVDAALRADLELRYDNALRGLDARLESFFGALESQGFLDDCIVVVTSDHGENLGEHGLVDHQASLHESVLRVPLFVTGPMVAAGATIDRAVVTTDVFRWTQDLSRHAFKPDATGRRPALSERMRPIELLARLESSWPDVDVGRLGAREKALVDPSRPRMKLVWREGASDRLFRLTDDPATEGEELSVEGGDGPMMRRALNELLAARRVLRETHLPELRSSSMDDAQDELSRLGYLSQPRDPNVSVHAQEHLALGNRAHAAGELETARDEWLAAARISPDFAAAWFNLAIATESLEPSLAREAWERYVEVALEGTDDPEKLEQAYRRLEELNDE